MNRPRSQIAQLAALGWRILPIPTFWEAGSIIPPQPRCPDGNAAYVDFNRADGYLVIPPDNHPELARKFPGRWRATKWAMEQAVALTKCGVA